MAGISASRLKDLAVALLYSAAIACCLAVSGVMLALVLCNFGFDLGLIRANANIDDDAAMITMAWGLGGALTGFVAGAVIGWRVIWPVKARRGMAMAGGMTR